jgi:putative ABC transport system permease protein
MGGLFLRDFRYARRMLRKNPTFTTTTVVTLALGIAASTVIFSIVDAVLLNPLDYNDPGQIYRIYTMDERGLPQGSTGRAHIDPMIETGESVQAAFYGYLNESSVVNREGTAFAINEYRVSEQFFGVFTEPLSMGRAFLPEDNFDTTILSYQTWRDVFGSDPDIIGSTIPVNNSGLRVLGVAAPGFEFPVGAAMWTKIYQGPGSENLFNLQGYARVRPGITGSQFQAELDVFSGRLEDATAAIVAGGSAVGWEVGRRLEFVARPLLHDVVGDFRGTLFIVSGATAILLLIACLNVANLLFTRAVVRTNEIAVREALGAGRWRLFRQLMTETVLLCALGGILGLVLAVTAVRVLQAIGPEDLPRFDNLAISQNVFLFAAACVLLTAFIVGVAPALRSSMTGLSSLLNEAGRSGSAGPGRNRIFGTLVVAEIALAVMLVIGAGLLVRSHSEIASADPGFHPQRMLTVLINVPGRLDLRAPRRDDSGAVIGYEGTGYLPVARFYQELMGRIEALPGVAAAGAASAAPLQAGLFPVYPDPIGIVGDSAEDAGGGRVAYSVQVAPEFFTALDVSPVAGRLLDSSDRRDSRGVVVVNETFARNYFDGADPLGRRITLPNPDVWRPLGLAFTLGERLVHEAEIVGVIPDVKQGTLIAPVQPAIYVPQEQWTMRRMAVVVRAQIDDPASLIPGIRNALAEMDSTIPPVFAIYSDVIASSTARQRLGALSLVVFGLVALVLAAVGIYGLVAYSASQRYNEIAVRAAMGADRQRLLGMFLGRGLRLAGIGIAAGLAGGIALGQAVASQLYEVSALDPQVFVLVPLIMLAVTLLASYLPARRASRIDLSAALRES